MADPAPCLRLLFGCLLLHCPLLPAQEYSHDGNRWYEIEVSVFTIAHPRTRYSEIAVPSGTSPSYLPRLLQLLPRSSSYEVDFTTPTVADPQTPPSFPADTQLVLPSLPPDPLQALLQQLRNGPLYSPALRDSFRLLDSERDPYLELDLRSGRFPALNRRLDAAGSYRVLWHRLWRQPVQGRAQVSSVFVTGGEQRGLHRELEGSLRFSDDSGRVMMDLDVWLNVFTQADPESETPWQIPALPFMETPAETTSSVQGQPSQTGPETQAEVQPELQEWLLTEVWRQQQTREIGAGQLYYLDHPTLGVLVEITPYVLPLPVALQTQAEAEAF